MSRLHVLSENIALATSAVGLAGRHQDSIEWKQKQAIATIAHCTKTKLRSWRYRLRNRPVYFVLNNWYGRLGNNVQQILIAILHAESFGGKFDLGASKIHTGSLAELVPPMSFDFTSSETVDSYYFFASNFFWYNEFSFKPESHQRLHAHKGWSPRLESLLSARVIEKQIHRVAVQHLRGKLIAQCIRPSLNQYDSDLVIHLRSGDIQDLSQNYYATNPLYYYQQLRYFHDKVVIVTEPGVEHVLLSEIIDLFQACVVVSGSVRDDFEFLRGARFLASSGVGTFAVAAALLATNLEIFYCSTLYQDEHLNPRMLSRDYVDVVQVELPGYGNAWNSGLERKNLLRNYRPGSVVIPEGS